MRISLPRHPPPESLPLVQRILIHATKHTVTPPHPSLPRSWYPRCVACTTQHKHGRPLRLSRLLCQDLAHPGHKLVMHRPGRSYRSNGIFDLRPRLTAWSASPSSKKRTNAKPAKPVSTAYAEKSISRKKRSDQSLDGPKLLEGSPSSDMATCLKPWEMTLVFATLLDKIGKSYVNLCPAATFHDPKQDLPPAREIFPSQVAPARLGAHHSSPVPKTPLFSSSSGTHTLVANVGFSETLLAFFPHTHNRCHPRPKERKWVSLSELRMESALGV